MIKAQQRAEALAAAQMASARQFKCGAATFASGFRQSPESAAQLVASNCWTGVGDRFASETIAAVFQNTRAFKTPAREGRSAALHLGILT